MGKTVTILPLLALLLGCPGSMVVNGQGAGDDDSAGDDDAADDDTQADDDDAIDPVDCGPLPAVEPGATGDVYTGAADVHAIPDGWIWEGCEVLRHYEAGELACESLWTAEGPMMYWSDQEAEGLFVIDFTPSAIDHACGGEEWSQWRYMADFDWEAMTVEIWWAGPSGPPQWEYWASGDVDTADQTQIVFGFATEFWPSEDPAPAR